MATAGQLLSSAGPGGTHAAAAPGNTHAYPRSSSSRLSGVLRTAVLLASRWVSTSWRQESIRSRRALQVPSRFRSRHRSAFTDAPVVGARTAAPKANHSARQPRLRRRQRSRPSPTALHINCTSLARHLTMDDRRGSLRTWVAEAETPRLRNRRQSQLPHRLHRASHYTELDVRAPQACSNATLPPIQSVP